MTGPTVPGGDGPGGPVPAQPWDLSHLRPSLLAIAALAVAAIPLTWWLRDGRSAAGVAVGLGIVAATFCVGAYAVALAGRVADSLTLPAALGAYMVTFVTLGVVLVSVPADGPVDVLAMAWAVVAGTLGWVGVHIRRVWTRRVLYVDSAGAVDSAAVAADEAARGRSGGHRPRSP